MNVIRSNNKHKLNSIRMNGKSIKKWLKLKIIKLIILFFNNKNKNKIWKTHISNKVKPNNKYMPTIYRK